MRSLYLDCGMGAAGDMLAAALLELIPDREAFLSKLNSFGIPGVTVSTEKSVKCGITGTHFAVTVHGEAEDEHMHEHHHHHSSMEDISHIISHLPLEPSVKADIIAVYNLVAEAESHVHGVPVSQIHFHELGSMDALADISAVCLLMHELKAEKIIASPVHVGSGTVRCAHGILPVPAPATAHILRGVPVYGGRIQSELCTPTGAALLKHFVHEFGPMPPMKTEAIGYGMGKKDFERANCLRAILGETEDMTDAVIELSCNVDDMTGEAAGHAIEALMAEGALDVFTVPIGMKKSRPGLLITLLCRPEDEDKFVRLMFRHTSTLGIRRQSCSRYTLKRRIETVETPYGPIRLKKSSGYGVQREKYEYEDLSRAAGASGASISEILDSLK